MKEIKFAENLKNLRNANGYTQIKLAGILGVDQRTISAWERGVCEPSFEILAKLATLFDQNFDELLT